MSKTGFTLALASLLFLPATASPGGDQAAPDEATKAQVRSAIQKYVEEDVALKDAFLVIDPRTGEPLRLAFDNVHAGVTPHEKGYLACADFKDRTGKVYDVDLVVGKARDRWEAKKVLLHKIDGKLLTEK
jgi:hypothetical protein